jgi:hypothetical protein
MTISDIIVLLVAKAVITLKVTTSELVLVGNTNIANIDS